MILLTLTEETNEIWRCKCSEMLGDFRPLRAFVSGPLGRERMQVFGATLPDPAQGALRG